MAFFGKIVSTCWAVPPWAVEPVYTGVCTVKKLQPVLDWRARSGLGIFVTCPFAFRQRRLAQNARLVLGLRHFCFNFCNFFFWRHVQVHFGCKFLQKMALVNPPWNFLHRIRNVVKSWKMVRFNPLLCLGVPTQCQRFQFYRGPWGLWFYRDFMLNTALSTSQQRVLGTAIL